MSYEKVDWCSFCVKPVGWPLIFVFTRVPELNSASTELSISGTASPDRRLPWRPSLKRLVMKRPLKSHQWRRGNTGRCGHVSWSLGPWIDYGLVCSANRGDGHPGRGQCGGAGPQERADRCRIQLSSGDGWADGAGTSWFLRRIACFGRVSWVLQTGIPGARHPRSTVANPVDPPRGYLVV